MRIDIHGPYLEPAFLIGIQILSRRFIALRVGPVVLFIGFP